ncbi:DUF2182 domain-containing protein [Trinickia sp. Y13]|uniref:DUF2182 domain-containing protein n=1 Tax=Trinickia sp. Y13 TaxID=2917807 RepID=UPI0024071214|nr:DUF2182 domain-containing protein [Trinickia sp. Y13]MDG0027444.1 DUF2182 domain-containing protein [Trinickia sp. Y13]
MGELPMPGGWSLSAMWMPMCGQTWLDAAAAFTFMWSATMAPMMLPSLAPALLSYWKRVRARGKGRAARATALAAASYFCAWTAFGAIVFVVGATVAANVMQSSALARAMPVCSGVTLLLAVGLQFTAWKARRVACRENVCRYGGINADDASAAVLHGLRLALHDGYCCANFMAALFAVGVMNPFAMGAVTVAMAVEQWAPWRVRTPPLRNPT